MDDSPGSSNGIVIERIFDAPVQLIWQLWTDPEHFKNWYGPTGFTVPVSQKDVRVGGKHLCCMTSPDGSMKMWTTGEFTEVVPYKRLVYTESPSDEDGNILLMSEEENTGGLPMLTQVTVELENLGGRTRMVLTHTGLPANSQGANEGWNQAFAKLADYAETVLSKQT